jgi:hypothetical protein
MKRREDAIKFTKRRGLRFVHDLLTTAKAIVMNWFENPSKIERVKHVLANARRINSPSVPLIEERLRQLQRQVVA